MDYRNFDDAMQAALTRRQELTTQFVDHIGEHGAAQAIEELGAIVYQAEEAAELATFYFGVKRNILVQQPAGDDHTAAEPDAGSATDSDVRRFAADQARRNAERTLRGLPFAQTDGFAAADRDRAVAAAASHLLDLHDRLHF